VYTDISAQCNNGDNCSINSCDRTFGCVRQDVVCPNSNCEVGYCRLGQCYTTRSGCIPRSVIITAVGGSVGIIAAIIIAVIVVMCIGCHGTAHYHGLHDYYINGPTDKDDTKETPLETSEYSEKPKAKKASNEDKKI